MTDYIGATTEIFDVLKNAWIADAGAPGILTTLFGVGKGYTPVLLCPGDIHTEDLDVSKIYAKAAYQTVTEPQTAFRSGDGTRLFEATGMLGVQVYCPKNVAKAYLGGKLLARLVQSSFRNPPAGGSVWYFNQRIIEQGAVQNSNQINIYVSCRYQTAE
jgi:hypothetical protein